MELNETWIKRPRSGRFSGEDVCSNSCFFFCLFVLFLFFPLLNSIICGLTQFTNKNHIAFAALEAVCFQTREVKAN